MLGVCREKELGLTSREWVLGGKGRPPKGVQFESAARRRRDLGKCCRRARTPQQHLLPALYSQGSVSTPLPAKAFGCGAEREKRDCLRERDCSLTTVCTSGAVTASRKDLLMDALQCPCAASLCVLPLQVQRAVAAASPVAIVNGNLASLIAGGCKYAQVAWCSGGRVLGPCPGGTGAPGSAIRRTHGCVLSKWAMLSPVVSSPAQNASSSKFAVQLI